jgi:hypothetical protein
MNKADDGYDTNGVPTFEGRIVTTDGAWIGRFQNSIPISELFRNVWGGCAEPSQYFNQCSTVYVSCAGGRRELNSVDWYALIVNA